MLKEPIVTEAQPGVERHLKVDMKYLAGLALSLFVALLYLSFVYLWHAFTPESGAPQVQTEATPEVFGGTVYLSLAPLTEAGEPGKVGIYGLDVESGALARVIGDNATESLTSEISPDGTSIALARIDEEGVMAIYYGDREMSELTAVPMPEGVSVARNPVWSPDGKTIAFTGKSDTNGSSLNLNEWNVYTVNLESGEVTLVSPGTNPLYLPDGALLVLREDGIHRLAGGDDQLILTMVEGGVAANMKLDVSRDGKRLAWALPDQSMVMVFTVTSWAPFTATTIEIPTAAFWPTFSPEGDFLAMQAFEWGEDGSTVTNYRLAYYSFRDNTWMESAIDLSPFYQDALFITDWR